MMTFKVTDKFDVCGHVPKRYIKKLIKAIEAVPQSIEIKELDKRIIKNLKPKTCANYAPFTGCRFNCDIAVPKWEMLVEVEKGKLPRLELDILKFQMACMQPEWNYGVLIVPSTHIQLPLAGRSTPVAYLKRLKRMIGPLDINLSVIGYEDPRSPA